MLGSNCTLETPPSRIPGSRLDRGVWCEYLPWSCPRPSGSALPQQLAAGSQTFWRSLPWASTKIAAWVAARHPPRLGSTPSSTGYQHLSDRSRRTAHNRWRLLSPGSTWTTEAEIQGGLWECGGLGGIKKTAFWFFHGKILLSLQADILFYTRKVVNMFLMTFL